jgi:pyrroloquinoline quinone biosynthesis protein B
MQDGGLPHMGCNKNCCNSARANGIELFPASLGIHDTKTDKLMLVDATPAIAKQVSLLHALSNVPEANTLFDSLLLTHAHMGHYAGLIQLGKESCNSNAIPTFTSERMSDFIVNNNPWSQLQKDNNIAIQTFNGAQKNETFAPLDGLQVKAIAVPHREDFSDTFAFKISGADKTILYVPDIDHLNDATLLGNLFDGVDIAYIDGAFYDENELPNRDITKIPHPFIVRSVEILQPYADSNPGMIRFIHLNHSNPALTDKRLQVELHQKGFGIALQGEQVAL